MKTNKCPHYVCDGDINNDCFGCVYSAEWHFDDGKCVRRPINLGRLQLMQFTGRIIKLDYLQTIGLWLLTLLVGIAIGRSYWLNCLIEYMGGKS